MQNLPPPYQFVNEIQSDEKSNVRIIRALSNANNETVILKSSVNVDLEQNRLLLREYYYLKQIYSHYGAKSASVDLLGIPQIVITTFSEGDFGVENDHLIDTNRILKPIDLIVHDSRNIVIIADTCSVPLRQLMHKPITLIEKLNLALLITESIEIIHEIQLLHLNINPDSIFVVETDSHIMSNAFLIDFRFCFDLNSKLEERHETTDNPMYLAPEMTGRTQSMVDVTSDIYCFGILLWEIFVGFHPFINDTDKIYSHLAKEIEYADKANPSVPRSIAKLINKMIQKDQKQRYQSVRSLKNDLEFLREVAKKNSGPLDSNLLDWMNTQDFTAGLNDQVPENLLSNEAWGRDKQYFQFESYIRNYLAEPTSSTVILLKGTKFSGRKYMIQKYQVASYSSPIILGTCPV
jgi:serine/threonine protein kinase